LILRRLEHHPQITHTNERTFFTDLDFFSFLFKEKQASKSVSYKQFIFNHSREKEFVLLRKLIKENVQEKNFWENAI